MRITEGELKADIAYVASGVPTISFPGVDSWRVVVPVLRELNVNDGEGRVRFRRRDQCRPLHESNLNASQR